MVCLSPWHISHWISISNLNRLFRSCWGAWPNPARGRLFRSVLGHLPPPRLHRPSSASRGASPTPIAGIIKYPTYAAIRSAAGLVTVYAWTGCAAIQARFRTCLVCVSGGEAAAMISGSGRSSVGCVRGGGRSSAREEVVGGTFSRWLREGSRRSHSNTCPLLLPPRFSNLTSKFKKGTPVHSPAGSMYGPGSIYGWV
jgi:hypothetical protein